MKISPDGGGAEVDPDELERLPDAGMEPLAREYAARRFPSLADAPIIGVTRLPVRPDAGHALPRRAPSGAATGGSSAAAPATASSTGPALAEYVADCVEGSREPEPFHGLGPRAATPACAPPRLDD